MIYKTKHDFSFYSEYEAKDGFPQSATAYGNKLVFPEQTEVEILIKYGDTKRADNYRVFCKTRCGYVAWLDMLMVTSSVLEK